jgi:hypothetical protein
MSTPHESELHFAMEITKHGGFTLTITGEADDVDALETDVFQPAVAEQLVAAMQAKIAERKAGA